MPSPILQAMKQIAEEKGLSYEAVLETVQSALAAAYRKDFGEKNQNVQIEFDPETGAMKAFDVKTVVEDLTPEELEALLADHTQTVAEKTRTVADNARTHPSTRAELGTGQGADAAPSPQPLPTGQAGSPSSGGEGGVSVPSPLKGEGKGEGGTTETTVIEEKRKFNPRTEIMISEATQKYPEAKLEDVIRTPLAIPAAFGRMAAMTAKQVIMQKLREAERGMIYNEYKDKAGALLTGVVGRREGRTVLVDLGKTMANLPIEGQVETDRYYPGTRMKFYLESVNLGTRGVDIRLSRAHEGMVKAVFSIEIPEVANGTVEIKGIAREAGGRSKVAVSTTAQNVDPIGSCIGQRGTRIQTVIAELGGEKIDIIEYDEDPVKYITKAMSPSKVARVELIESEKLAVVYVIPEQFSLAIGRGGQNVRLAARLTGWKITVREEGGDARSESSEVVAAEEAPATEPQPEATVVAESTATAPSEEATKPTSSN